jgi:hypothetical protein
MTLAQLGQHALVQRPRASNRLFPGQDAVASRQSPDPAMLPASVRAPPEEEHLASDGVDPVGSMLRIGQQLAERITPFNCAQQTAERFLDRHAAERVGGLASTSPNRRGEAW